MTDNMNERIEKIWKRFIVIFTVKWVTRNWEHVNHIQKNVPRQGRNVKVANNKCCGVVCKNMISNRKDPDIDRGIRAI